MGHVIHGVKLKLNENQNSVVIMNDNMSELKIRNHFNLSDRLNVVNSMLINRPFC